VAASVVIRAGAHTDCNTSTPLGGFIEGIHRVDLNGDRVLEWGCLLYSEVFKRYLSLLSCCLNSLHLCLLLIYQ
jgi:hypothetical protein